jgi:hypothetical protein
MVKYLAMVAAVVGTLMMAGEANAFGHHRGGRGGGCGSGGCGAGGCYAGGGCNGGSCSVGYAAPGKMAYVNNAPPVVAVASAPVAPVAVATVAPSQPVANSYASTPARRGFFGRR